MLLLSLLSLACQEQRGFGDQLPREERVLVLIPESLKGSLDPRLNTRAWPGKIIQLIFEGVVSVNHPDLKPRPALAERIEQPSPKIYEIFLREAHFQDGSPVRAIDVKATYESVLNPALRSPFRGMYARIKALEVLGPRRLRVHLKAPHAPFLSDMSLGILPAHSLDGSGQLKGPLIGAGPYHLQERQGQRELLLSRFEGYWRGRPEIPYLVMRSVRDENTRLLAILGGAADLLQNSLSPRMAEALAKRPKLALSRAPGISYNYIAFNLREPPLQSLKVRQALAHAINRERLIQHKFRGSARAAQGMLPEGHWAYLGEQRQYPYDPAKARELLDKAGFPDPPGPAPRFQLSLKTSTEKFRRNLARLMRDDLLQVGIKLKVRALEKSTLLADVKRGNFQLYTLSWGDPSEPHFYNWIFHSQNIPPPSAPGQGGNRGAYLNPEVDRLIEAGRLSSSLERRRQVYHQLQRILAEELPYLSLWHEDVWAIRAVDLEYEPLPNASLFPLWRARWRRP